MGLLQENQSLNLEYQRNKELRELKDQLQQKENIIKEVREYIEERRKYKGEPFYLDEIQTEIVCEILDKENK